MAKLKQLIANVWELEEAFEDAARTGNIRLMTEIGLELSELQIQLDQIEANL